MRRTVMQAPTPTLEELEIHITTLNAGQVSHEPHRHPAEELLIVKEGQVETLQNGKATRLGPGSIIFHSSNDLHNIRNVGSIPATYHVIQWKSAGTPPAPAPAPLVLNHVAISVPDLDEGIRYYTKALGLKEAFTFRDNRGSPLSYLQISRDTFLELQGATADRPPGLIHIGLEVADLRASIPRLKAGGLIVRDPSTSARTGAVISQAEGQSGLRFELLEFGPDSLQRKVINDWKPKQGAVKCVVLECVQCTCQGCVTCTVGPEPMRRH